MIRSFQLTCGCAMKDECISLCPKHSFDDFNRMIQQAVEVKEKEINSCPACSEKRLHSEEEWKFHPLSGQGFDGNFGNGSKWTSERARIAHEEDLKRRRDEAKS